MTATGYDVITRALPPRPVFNPVTDRNWEGEGGREGGREGGFDVDWERLNCCLVQCWLIGARGDEAVAPGDEAATPATRLWPRVTRLRPGR